MQIIFSDWTITLGSGRGPMQYDDGELLEVINAPSEWTWTLNAKLGGDLEVIPLTETDGKVEATLTAGQLALAGNYLLQLVGKRDGTTKHTNVISMTVLDSLSGDAQWPELPTVFSDAVDRAEDAADRAESAATHGPRVSGTNTWEVWDPDKGQYVDTMVEASGKAGPQGPAGVDGTTPDIQIGTVTTLEPGEDATASIGGTVAEPLLNLGIPKGAKGDKGDGGGGSDISLGLTSATVGQTIKVKAVDDGGRPTEWEKVNTQYELIQTITMDKTVESYVLADMSVYRKVFVKLNRTYNAEGSGNVWLGTDFNCRFLIGGDVKYMRQEYHCEIDELGFLRMAMFVTNNEVVPQNITTSTLISKSGSQVIGELSLDIPASYMASFDGTETITVYGVKW